MAKAAVYDESSIDVLEGAEAIRSKIGMYLGGKDKVAIWQSLKEVITNALDEALQGYGKRLVVVMDSKRNKFTVVDSGRGIPVGIHPKTKISTLTTVLTKLHAGGKLKADNTAYGKGAAGTHGVGVSCTNATASKFIAHTCREGKWYRQDFSEGVPTTEVKKVKEKDLPDMPKGAKAPTCGTIIEFESDKKIFGKAQFDPKEPVKWLRTIAYFFPQIEFVLSVDGKVEIFQQKDGVAALIKSWLKKAGADAIGKPFFFQSNNVTVALQWAGTDKEGLTGYVNALEVSKGTHMNALQKIINDAFVKYKTTKQEFKAEDLRVGLYGVVNIAMTAPEFGGQTKERLTSKEGGTLVKEALAQEFATWLEKNKAFAKELIGRAVNLRLAHAEFSVNKKMASKLQTVVKGRTLLPPNLSICTSKNPMDRELFIVEGESAEGPAVMARDRRFHEILPIKGKILNVHKAKADRIAKNQEIEDILKSIGYNPKHKDPLSKLRVGKIMLLSDADADGKHINLLLSGFIYKALRPLIKQGRVYAVNAPLFTAQHKSKRLFGYTLPELMKQLPDNFNPDHVTRMKGLGESVHPLTIVGRNNSIKTIVQSQTMLTAQGANSNWLKIPKEKDEIGTLLTAAGFLMLHPKHPVLVFRNWKFAFVKASQVEQGDFLMIKPYTHDRPISLEKCKGYGGQPANEIELELKAEDLADLQNIQEVQNNQMYFTDMDLNVCVPDYQRPFKVKFASGSGHFRAVDVLSKVFSEEVGRHIDPDMYFKLPNFEEKCRKVTGLREKILTMYGVSSILGMRWTPFIKSEFYTTQSHTQYDISITENTSSLFPELTNNTFMANNFVVHNCNADVMHDIAFNSKTRRLIQLMPVKGSQATRFLGTLEAEADFRREILGLSKSVKAIEKSDAKVKRKK